MYQSLPVLMSKESVDFGSSKSEFGASVRSMTMALASKLSPPDSWMSSYVPYANGVISIWNAIVEN